MGFNFPDVPTLNQLYPASVVTGQPQYVWNGYAWSPVSGGNSAPFESMMYNNIIINGSFEVNQPMIASVTTNVTYFCDSWMLHMNNVGGLQANAAQVYNPANFNGLPYFARIQPTTASATLTGNDGCGLYARIEGWRLARLNWGTPAALPVTIGFWSNHTLPGLYTVAFRGASNASYVATYTHNVSVVAQYNVITVPGCTISTWTPDNTLGLSLTFGLGYGPGLQAPAANVWSTGNYTSLANAVNACASTSNLFRITGVTLFPGINGPSANNYPSIMRPYDQELQLSRRYFYNGQPPLRGLVANSTSAWRVAARHPVAMRAAPAVTITSPVNMFDGTTNTTMSAVITNWSTIDVLEFDGTLAVTVAGRPIVLSQGGAGNINVDARL